MIAAITITKFSRRLDKAEVGGVMAGEGEGEGEGGGVRVGGRGSGK